VLVLAIETSCDETSAAVVEDGRTVLQRGLNADSAARCLRRVVPEIASRQHVRVITSVVEEALKAAAVDTSQLDYVAATRGPGLAGALLVGVNFARALAFSLSARTARLTTSKGTCTLCGCILR
jgi:N6-L-threonylcarbamoyladenine synthase